MSAADKLTAEQAARLASPEVRAAMALLVALQHEALLDEIAGLGQGDFAVQYPASYVSDRIINHVARGYDLCKNVQPPDEWQVTAWRRLLDAVADARAVERDSDLRHLAILGEPRTVCGLVLANTLIHESEFGVAWPFDDARRLRYVGARKLATCPACNPSALASGAGELGVSPLASGQTTDSSEDAARGPRQITRAKTPGVDPVCKHGNLAAYCQDCIRAAVRRVSLDHGETDVAIDCEEDHGTSPLADAALARLEGAS